jgi:hypothetical protein
MFRVQGSKNRIWSLRFQLGTLNEVNRGSLLNRRYVVTPLVHEYSELVRPSFYSEKPTLENTIVISEGLNVARDGIEPPTRGQETKIKK